MNKSVSQHGFGKPKDQRSVFPVQPISQLSPGISDSAKNAKIGSHPDQNPIGVLQEMFAKVDISPHYEFKTITEDIAPVFITTVTIGSVKVSSRGPTKKEAKSKAARAAIDELNRKNLNPLSMGVKKVEMISAEQFEKVRQNSGSYSNAVKTEPSENCDGAEILTNLCRELSLPSPSYPHVHVECQVGDRVVFGSGRNPLQAREDAATQMITLINKQRLEEWTKHVIPLSQHVIPQTQHAIPLSQHDIPLSQHDISQTQQAIPLSQSERNEEWTQQSEERKRQDFPLSQQSTMLECDVDEIYFSD